MKYKLILVFIIVFSNFLFSTNTFEKSFDLGGIEGTHDVIFHQGEYYFVGRADTMLLVGAVDSTGQNFRYSCYFWGDSVIGMAIEEGVNYGLVVMANFRSQIADSILIMHIDEDLTTVYGTYMFGADSDYISMRGYDLMLNNEPMFSNGYLIAGELEDITAYTTPMLLNINDTTFTEEWRRQYFVDVSGGLRGVCANQQSGMLGMIGFEIAASGYNDVMMIIGFQEGIFCTKRLFGDPLLDEFGLGIAETPDGFLLSSSVPRSVGIGSDLWLINWRLSDSSIIWDSLYTIADSMHHEAREIVNQSDSGFVLGGLTSYFGLIQGVFCLKINQLGQQQWVNYYDQSIQRGAFSINKADQGFILAGSSFDTIWSSGTEDVYLLKVDSLGNLHQECYSVYGDPTTDERSTSMAVSEQDGYILGGNKQVNRDDQDFYLVKTDPWGGLIWDNYYGAGGTDEVLNSVNYSEILGQYLLLGQTNVQDTIRSVLCYVLPDGTLNQFSIGDLNTTLNCFCEFVENKAKGFILIGSTRSNVKDTFINIEVKRFDSLGIIIWQNIYTIPGDQIPCSATDLQFINDVLGGFILIGSTRSNVKDTVNNVFLMNIHPDGQLGWHCSYFPGEGYGVIQEEMNVYSTGYALSNDSVKDVFVMCLTGDTIPAWTTIPELVGDQVGYDIMLVEDTLVVSGYSRGSIHSPSNFDNVMVMKFDKFSGDYLGMAEFFEDGNQRGYDCFYTYDNCYAINGFTDYNGTDPADAMFMKTYPPYSPVVSVEEEPPVNLNDDVQVAELYTPQPLIFNDHTRIGFTVKSASVINVAIYDITGREVRTLANSVGFSPGYYEYVWDSRDNSGETVSPGTYFIRLNVNQQNLMEKAVLIK
ncbi:MAG: FlgD immunoglobulin-like domain containing protein [bacterium]